MIVSVIARTIHVPLQLGGGIRSMGDIEEKLNCGVDRVIIGTAAVNDRTFAKRAVEKYGDKIVIGVDAAEGRVKTDGWLTDSGVTAEQLCGQMAEIGVKTVIFTDILKDGMMAGANIEGMKRLIDSYGQKMDFIASGGISSRGDLTALKEAGAKGVIIGRALYDGTLDLGEVIKDFER
jgi:phosphoribosylformimino-5-aminoimidazole carboxamide ribotide isomerase